MLYYTLLYFVSYWALITKVSNSEETLESHESVGRLYCQVRSAVMPPTYLKLQKRVPFLKP